MRPPVAILILGASVVAVGLACSPHEFNDPTGATSKILFQQTPGAPPPPPQAGPPTAPSPPALTPATRPTRDVVELTTGERIEGTVVQTTATELVIEVGGTEIRFGRDRLKAVFYGRR